MEAVFVCWERWGLGELIYKEMEGGMIITSKWE